MSTIWMECIEWDGMLDKGGYGYVRKKPGRYQAHRLAWMEQIGPIPEGMKVLHKCDNPPCVNIDHLFLGTQAQNVVDMALKGRDVNGKKTHCKYGHPFSGDNLTFAAGKLRPRRRCKQCMRNRQARWRARQ